MIEERSWFVGLLSKVAEVVDRIKVFKGVRFFDLYKSVIGLVEGLEVIVYLGFFRSFDLFISVSLVVFFFGEFFLRFYNGIDYCGWIIR